MINNNGKPANFSDGCLLVVPWDLEHAGGVNEVVINLYRQFVRNNLCRPMVLIPSWEHRIEQLQCESGRKTLRLRLQEAPRIGLAQSKEILAFALRLPITLWRLHALISRHGISVVNAHYPGLHLIHFALLKIFHPRKFRFVVSFHGSDVTAMETSKRYASVMKWILLKANVLTVPSDSLATRLTTVAPRTNGKIKRIYNGVDQDKFLRDYMTSQLLPLQLRDKFFVLHVGSFERVKGQDILLKAFKKLNEQHPEMHLLLVGRNGSFMGEVERIIEVLGLSEKVYILTNVKHEEIPALMKSAYFIVLPSRSEGFPLVLLESAMSNRAVIASRTGGIPELIRDRENGLLVDPENHDQLASAMAEMVADSQLRNRLAEKLTNTVSMGFSWEKTAREYADSVVSV